MTLWLLFSAVAILGNLIYLIGLKLADGRINPFFFTFLLSTVALTGHAIMLLFYRFILRENITLQYDRTGALLAVMVGLGVVIIDFGIFFAFRHGSAITTHLVLAVGTAIAFSALAAWWFGEPITPARATGIVLGLISLVLIVRG